MKYSLAVSSKIPLSDSTDLNRMAYLLGKQIASEGHFLISPVQLSLVYQAAAGVSDKAGLSIGFSPASNLREHSRYLQLPTDVYDWIYCSSLHENALLARLVASSQALILIGGVMANLSELALASESLMPVGVLLDAQNQANNDLLQYLQSLSLEKQKHIVVHKDPQILLNTIIGMLDIAYRDLGTSEITQNNRFFRQLIENAGKVSE